MFERQGRSDEGVAALLASAHTVLDALQAVDLTPCSDDEAITAIRDFERLRRRIETVDHALLLDIEQRGIPARAMSGGTGGWLRATLLVDIHEANARVRAAHAAGPRRSLLGEPLPAKHPVVAAGQAAGEVSAKQARIITTMLDKLPVAVCEVVPEVEARLVGFCGAFDPWGLQKLADHERDWLDPDGGYREVERRRRDRDLRSSRSSCRSSSSEQAYATGSGFATTGHGAQVPVREAMSWAGGDYRLFATVLNSLKAVVAYSSTHRLFTEGQRLALIARAGGCAFPSCTAPPGWTQTHHVIEHQDQGPTSVDNGCLLCGMHHREFERMGWQVHISDGRPPS